MDKEVYFCGTIIPKWYLYNLENENIMQILHMIGKKRGTIISGGRIDEEKVSNLLIEEFRRGKLGKITLERP